MSFIHYETSTKNLRKDVRVAEKYGRMIDPNELVEGAEYLYMVLCKGCNKIASRLNVKECIKCKSIICEKCYQ